LAKVGKAGRANCRTRFAELQLVLFGILRAEVVEYGIEHAHQLIDLPVVELCPGFAPGTVYDRQHLVDFLIATIGKLNAEPPPVIRVRDALGKPFLAQ
jgi:hypothetical protein